MYFINFKINKIFYFRLLLCNRKKTIFFKNIRTINMQIKNATKKVKKSRLIINKKTYVFLSFINNDKKWYKTIKKAIEFEIIVILQDLLLTIFFEYEFFEFRTLWKKHKIAYVIFNFDMLRWLSYNFLFNCKNIINRQYSNLSILEKFEFLSKNFKIIQRSKQRIKKILQY